MEDGTHPLASTVQDLTLRNVVASTRSPSRIRL